MEDFTLKIPPVQIKKDLTIIYEDAEDQFHKIEITKEDFLRTLRYFQKRSGEINQTKFVYIKENIEFKIFNDFISSISSSTVKINEANYKDYLYLSQKYEYEELEEQINEFIQNRPDLSSIINQLAQSQNTTKNYVPDINKEEIIARNLDISIQNGLLQKLPIFIIVRILNSPKRVIKNHDLLFSFVINYLQEKEKDESFNNNEDFVDDLLILPSSLDYCEMTSEEMEQLFRILNSNPSFFTPRNHIKVIQQFISNEKKMQDKYEKLEQKIKENEENHKKQILQLQESFENRLAIIEKYQETEKKKEDQKEERIRKIESAINSIQMLESQRQDEINKKLANLEKNQQERIQNEIKERFKNINASINQAQCPLKKIQIHLNAVECPNGIFQYLFDKYKSSPVDKGLIKINGNSFDGNETILHQIIDSKWDNNWWASQNKPNSHVKIDFKNASVKINKYKIKVGDTDNSQLFTSWILTGITEGGQTITLDEVTDSKEITENHPEATIQIQNNHFVRAIQLQMNGKNSNNSYYMCIRNIELFGSLKV